MTLDDLEGPFRTLFQNACVFWGTTKISKSIKIDPKHQQEICSAMAVVSGNNYKVHADIRGGSLETRRQTIVG